MPLLALTRGVHSGQPGITSGNDPLRLFRCALPRDDLSIFCYLGFLGSEPLRALEHAGACRMPLGPAMIIQGTCREAMLVHAWFP